LEYTFTLNNCKLSCCNKFSLIYFYLGIEIIYVYLLLIILLHYSKNLECKSKMTIEDILVN